MSSEIEFVDLYGQKKLIPKERSELRASAYGIVLHESKILLSNTRSTGKFSLPGGAIDQGERLEDALGRELREECGIEASIEKFLDFEERFFYYNPLDKAWHVLAFIYLCSPKTFELTDAANELGDESESPRWVPVETLSANQFQVFGEKVMRFLKEPKQ